MEKNSIFRGKNNFLWSIIKYKPVLYIFTVTIQILKSLLLIFEGIIIKEIFDVIGGKTDSVFQIYELIGIIGGIAIVHIIILRVMYKKSMLHNYLVSSLIRRNMLGIILKNFGGRTGRSSTGEIINSFRDDVNQIEGSIHWFATLISQIILSICALGIMSSINLKITFFAVMPLSVVIVLAQRFEKNIEKNRSLSRNATGFVNGVIGEVFQGILAVKVSGAKKDIMSNLDILNEKRYKAMIKDSTMAGIINSIYDNATNIGTGIILLLGAGAIAKGTFTVGDFSLFVYYLYFVTDSIESLGNFIVYFKQTKVGVKNIVHKINCENDSEKLLVHKEINLKESIEEEWREEKSVDDLKSLEVRGLNCTYKENGNGVKNIDFEIKKGEIAVICGETGAGKSTLVKAILGLIPLESGEIYWNGKNVINPKEFFVPPVSAYTSQVSKLFSDTVKNNILLGINEEKEVLDWAVKSAAFEKDLIKLENGLDTIIGTNGAKLSGGQKQRIAVARMLVRKSQLLVFDDISSALDIETEKLMWKRLLQNNPTCIIVSNRRQVLEMADNIIFLKNGYIEAQGTLEELREKSIERILN